MRARFLSGAGSGAAALGAVLIAGCTSASPAADGDCVSHADCGEAAFCIDGTCADLCNSDADCPAIAPFCIESAEDHHARKHNANFTAHTIGLSRRRWIGRQHQCNGLFLNGIWVSVYGIGIVVG